MELITLQNEMIAALKSGNRERKETLSTLVGAIKKAAIDKRCRDNIPESLVNEVLLKELKTVQEQIDTCPEERIDLMEKYVMNLAIISEFAPKLITDEIEIQEMIFNIAGHMELTKKNRGAIMKVLAPALKGKADMSIVNKVLANILV